MEIPTAIDGGGYRHGVDVKRRRAEKRRGEERGGFGRFEENAEWKVWGSLNAGKPHVSFKDNDVLLTRQELSYVLKVEYLADGVGANSQLIARQQSHMGPNFS